MSHRALGRQRYFEKHIRFTPDVDSYIKAMTDSPYQQHKTAAKQLKVMASTMEKQKNSAEFAHSLGLKG